MIEMVKYKMICNECKERMYPTYYYGKKRKFKTISDENKGRAYICLKCKRFRFYKPLKQL